MMVYFDTNVLIYAFCKNVDNVSQQDISVSLFDKGIKEQNIILSEVTLCEFAFISHKLKEKQEDTANNLQFLATFLRNSDITISHRMLAILHQKALYVSSFDVYHLAFAEYYDAKLYTFDKGFKKLKEIAKIDIEIP